MDRKLMEQFMLKVTIPEAKVRSQECESGQENKRLRDAVWRAHRDVLTGRFYLPNYCGQGEGNANLVVKTLYELIKGANTTELLSSKQLINQVKCKFTDKRTGELCIEFGAIQKLVNMTLKYIVLLNEFEEKFHIEVNEKACDCPVDSVILAKLKSQNKIPHTSWTVMKETEYNNVQKEIKEVLEEDGLPECGQLYYDFLNW